MRRIGNWKVLSSGGLLSGRGCEGVSLRRSRMLCNSSVGRFYLELPRFCFRLAGYYFAGALEAVDFVMSFLMPDMNED